VITFTTLAAPFVQIWQIYQFTIVYFNYGVHTGS